MAIEIHGGILTGGLIGNTINLILILIFLIITIKIIKIITSHCLFLGLFFLIIFSIIFLLFVLLPVQMNFYLLLIASIAITFIVYFPLLREEKKSIVFASIILLTFFISIILLILYYFVIPLQLKFIASTLLQSMLKENWVDSEWDCFKPDCYSAFHAKKYNNTSLKLAAFYYECEHFNSPKCIYTKLFCGITDSRTAYERYERLLSNSGFSIEYGLDNFTARNETTIIYCQLDGDFVIVVKLDKEEEYLLNQTEIMKGRF